MDLKERGHEDIDMGSGQDPVAGSCETWYRIYKFHKRWVVSRLSKWLLASQGRRCFMELCQATAITSAAQLLWGFHGFHQFCHTNVIMIP